jgi:putative ABC transport system permease protein
MKKIFLARHQLFYTKTRLLIAILGISFADVLMFMQLGFKDALYESSVVLHKNFNGDLFLINSQSNSLVAMKNFSRRYLYKSLEIDDIAQVSPVYLEFGFWRNPFNYNSRAILVMGINPQYNPFSLPGLEEQISALKMPDAILFDESSRPEYGAITEKFNQGKNITAELRGRKVKVTGLFSLGASFSSDGNALTSDINFIRIFKRNIDDIEIGVIKLKPGADLTLIQSEIRQFIPKNVTVLTKEEFMNFEKKYWQESTSIGFIFYLGTTMGFIVGIVIVYQILYTDVSDHLSEYATLKAMGYSDFYFFYLIFQEALMLAILGYIPGLAISAYLYSLTASATSLPLFVTATKATTVFVCTVLMCCISGAIAMNKLRKADPADCF